MGACFSSRKPQRIVHQEPVSFDDLPPTRSHADWAIQLQESANAGQVHGIGSAGKLFLTAVSLVPFSVTCLVPIY